MGPEKLAAVSLKAWRRCESVAICCAAATAPVVLTGLIVLAPDAWPKPYSWQYLGLAIAATLAGGLWPGAIALALSIAAVLWLQVPTPPHPGAEMFAAVGGVLLWIIDRGRTARRDAHDRALVLRAVIDAMPDAVYVGTQDGVVLCNANALRLLGARSIDDLQARIGELGRNFAIRDPETGALFAEHDLPFSRALRGETVVQEVEATNGATGGDVMLRTACAPVFDRGRVVAAVSVNSDVTARTRTETALRQGERRYRRTLDEMLEGCAVVDPEWTCLYANATFASQTHVDLDQLVGRDVRTVLPGIETNPIGNAFQRCLDHQSPQSVVAAYTFRGDGCSWFDVKVRPVPEGVFVLSLDVTERTRAEERLRAGLEILTREPALSDGAQQYVKALQHSLASHPIEPAGACAQLLVNRNTAS